MGHHLGLGTLESHDLSQRKQCLIAIIILMLWIIVYARTTRNSTLFSMSKMRTPPMPTFTWRMRFTLAKQPFKHCYSPESDSVISCSLWASLIASVNHSLRRSCLLLRL